MERRRTSAGLVQTSCPVGIPRGGVRTPPEISSARDSETAAAVSVSSTITLFLTPKVLILPTSLSSLTFESRVSLDIVDYVFIKVENRRLRIVRFFKLE